MAVPTLITELSTTAASNAPAGADSPSTLDDIQRAHAAFIAQLRDRTAADWTNTPAGNIAATTVQAALDEIDTEKASIASIQAQSATTFTTAGTSTAYTLTPSPAIAAYAAGQSFFVTFHAASGAAPTLAISGLATPPNLVKQLGDGVYANIVAGDIPINHRSRMTLLSATQALIETLPGRRIGQVPVFQTGAVATGITPLPADNTIPQITEGDQYLSLSITPINAASLLEVSVTLFVSSSIVQALTAALFRDAGANAVAVAAQFQPTATGIVCLSFKHTVIAGSVAATTFKVRAGGAGANTTTFNGQAGAASFGGALASSIIIKEFLP